MAVPRLRVSSVQPGGSLRQAAGLSSDEVELYHRTYTTLLRSSGETHLRVLEPSHAAMNSSPHPLASSRQPDPGAFGGAEEDWSRIRDAWDGSLANFLDEVRDRRLNLRIRMLGGSQAGYARVTRRWMAPVRAALEEQGLAERPLYFVSSNTHSLV